MCKYKDSSLAFRTRKGPPGKEEGKDTVRWLIPQGARGCRSIATKFRETLSVHQNCHIHGQVSVFHVRIHKIPYLGGQRRHLPNCSYPDPKKVIIFPLNRHICIFQSDFVYLTGKNWPFFASRISHSAGGSTLD